MLINPIVTIINPIKNEEKNIKKCLLQILSQTYDKSKTEVLVVDGNSQDNTIRIIEEFKIKNSQLKIKIIQDSKRQRSSAMNEGIKHATGDIILRIDARTIIPSDYIEKCVNTLLETGADNVGGIQKPVDDEALNLTQLAMGYAMSHPFGVGNAQFRLGKKSGYVDSVYLGCFKRKVFSEIGLFDETSPVITEDSDINYRIRKNGGKVYLNKDIVAYYIPRERLSDLAKLYFRYGGARAGFLLKWKTYTGWRQLVPPVFMAVLLFLPIVSIFIRWCWYAWLLLIIVYGCADFCFSLEVAQKSKRKEVFSRLLLIFPIMHFCWASGFWKRLFQRKKTVYWGY